MLDQFFTLIDNIRGKNQPENNFESIRKKFLELIPEIDEIGVDCGANVGIFTELMAKKGGIVYAFEPNPFAFEKLNSRFKEFENIHCFQKGVLDRSDVVRLFLHELSDQDELKWSTGSSVLDFKKNVRRDKFIEVETIDLTEFIFSLPRNVKLLKMDVEGVECRIIKRMIDAGAFERIEHAFIETHDHKIPELKRETEDIRCLIQQMGLSSKVNFDWR